MWFRSSPTRAGPSAWRGCFGRLAFSARWASSIGRRTPTSSCIIARIRRARSLQEGINEPGAMASFIAAGTSYSTSNVPMIPFYIYYSMFGFQRVGDLAWAAGDMRTRGFLIGGTSGARRLTARVCSTRTATAMCSPRPFPIASTYDPTYGYELAVIIQRRPEADVVDQDDVYYYITTLERELCPSGHARRGGGGHSQRRV